MLTFHNHPKIKLVTETPTVKYEISSLGLPLVQLTLVKSTLVQLTLVQLTLVQLTLVQLTLVKLTALDTNYDFSKISR
jgi:hypothetical protein